VNAYNTNFRKRVVLIGKRLMRSNEPDTIIAHQGWVPLVSNHWSVCKDLIREFYSNVSTVNESENYFMVLLQGKSFDVNLTMVNSSLQLLQLNNNDPFLDDSCFDKNEMLKLFSNGLHINWGSNESVDIQPKIKF
jgi:hypothetical protein